MRRRTYSNLFKWMVPMGDELVDNIEVARNDIPQILSSVISLLAENEKATVNENGKVEITRTVDSDCELSYIWGETPIPKPQFYEVKLNDIISGNIPFRQDVIIYFQICSKICITLFDISLIYCF